MPTKTRTSIFFLKLKFLHIMWEIYPSKIKSKQNLYEENKFLQRFIPIS